MQDGCVRQPIQASEWKAGIGVCLFTLPGVHPAGCHCRTFAGQSAARLCTVVLFAPGSRTTGRPTVKFNTNNRLIFQMITTNQAVGGGGHPLRIVPGAPSAQRSFPGT